MQALIGLCKIVGAILTIWLINRNGRQKTLMLSSLLFAIALCLIGVGVVFFPQNRIDSNATTTNAPTALPTTRVTNVTTASMLLPSCGNADSTNEYNLTWFAAVFGLTIANVLLAILYALSQLLVIEYYPTSIRSTALGLCMVVQRFSSMLASFLAESSDEVGSMEMSVEIVSVVGLTIFIISCYFSLRKQSVDDNCYMYYE